MWYEDFVKTNKDIFLQKVKEISSLLGINPNWLMFVMRWESSLNPAAVNPISGATGLIQFLPYTAKSLGTSTTALKNMSNIDQLDYVYKYYAPYRGKIKSLYDCYLVVFFPAALGKPDSWILQTSSTTPGIIAAQNPALDLNKDGKITVGEFKQYIDKKKVVS